MSTDLKLATPYPLVGKLGKPLGVLVADLTGTQNPVGIILSPEVAEILLATFQPEGTQLAFNTERFQELKAEKLAWVNTTGKGDQTVLQPVGLGVERNQLQIFFTEVPFTDSAAARAVLEELRAEGGITMGHQVIAMANSPLGTPADYCRNLGVAVALITVDKKLVLAIRSPSNAFDVNMLAPAAETALAAHVEGSQGTFDLAVCAASGLEKEFGVSGPLDINFTSYFTQGPGGGPALLGVAHTKLTSDQVIAGHPNAPDQSEGSLFVCDWNLPTAFYLLNDPGSVSSIITGEKHNGGWACWGPPLIMQAIERDFGAAIVMAIAQDSGYPVTPQLRDRAVEAVISNLKFGDALNEADYLDSGNADAYSQLPTKVVTDLALIGRSTPKGVALTSSPEQQTRLIEGLEAFPQARERLFKHAPEVLRMIEHEHNRQDGLNLTNGRSGMGGLRPA